MTTGNGTGDGDSDSNGNGNDQGGGDDGLGPGSAGRPLRPRTSRRVTGRTPGDLRRSRVVRLTVPKPELTDAPAATSAR